MKALIVLLFCMIPTIGHTQIDNRYLTSIIYLNTQESVVERVNYFFRKDIPRKSKVIPFYVNDIMVYIDSKVFKNDVLNNTIINETNFDPINTGFFGKLIPNDNKTLVLTFSMISDNLLVAEINNFKSNTLNKVKFGRGYRILFIFDNKGLITSIHEKTFIYN